MTEEELKEKIEKDLDEALNVKNIIDFHFDLLQKAYVKGLDTGLKAYKEEAKNIIQDLLNNSDEYARQRAIDFLKEAGE